MDIVAIFDAVETHALACGHFERVNGHEPKGHPSASGLTAALWIDQFQAARNSSGLNSTTLRLGFNLRIYTNMLAEPQDAIDPEVMAAVDALVGRLIGDYTLGGLVRAVDIRGMDGAGLSGQAGYLNSDGKQLRVMTVTLPVIVNDVWSEAP